MTKAEKERMDSLEKRVKDLEQTQWNRLLYSPHIPRMRYIDTYLAPIIPIEDRVAFSPES